MVFGRRCTGTPDCLLWLAGTSLVAADPNSEGGDLAGRIGAAASSGAAPSQFSIEIDQRHRRSLANIR
jgi:hypothetical protein